MRLCAYNLALLATGRARQHAYVHDDRFDRDYGVETAGVLAVDEMFAATNLKTTAEAYEATPPESFSYLLREAGVSEPNRYTFVDLGSGKGRALLLAALSGFDQVVGVEFCSQLNSAACTNIARFSKLRAAKVTALLGDAGSYQFPPCPTVCYINNPFGPEVLRRALDNIEASLRAAPREFRLIYFHSNHVGVVREREDWEEISCGNWRYKRHHYAIFRWKPLRRVPD